MKPFLTSSAKKLFSRETLGGKIRLHRAELQNVTKNFLILKR